MKDKIKFSLDNEEKVLIVNSLTVLKESLIEQNISTDSVEEIISKISSKPTLELDILDSKIVIKALYEMRGKLKEEEKPHTSVNNVLLKMIDVTNKKENFKKGMTR